MYNISCWPVHRKIWFLQQSRRKTTLQRNSSCRITINPIQYLQLFRKWEYPQHMDRINFWEYRLSSQIDLAIWASNLKIWKYWGIRISYKGKTQFYEIPIKSMRKKYSNRSRSNQDVLAKHSDSKRIKKKWSRKSTNQWRRREDRIFWARN